MLEKRAGFKPDARHSYAEGEMKIRLASVVRMTANHPSSSLHPNFALPYLLSNL